MFEGLINLMEDTPILVFFLVLGLGYLAGRIGIGGMSLGPAGGVLLVGLLFGHFGYTMSPHFQTLGFAIFIFCVGYQAGPQFFDVLMTDGLKYLSLALIIAATGLGLALSLANVLELEPGLAAGLLGGALTTTPTLAAAQDAVTSGLATVPDGFTKDDLLTNIGAGYALTYLFGLIGLILIIRLLPKFLKINLPEEAAKLEGSGGDKSGSDLSEITRRTYRITNADYFNQSIQALEMASKGKVSIAALRRAGKVINIDYDTRFEVGDEVLAVGTVELLLQHASKVGEEMNDHEGLGLSMSTFKVVVSNRAIIGKPVGDLRLDERIGALPLQIRRQRMVLPLDKDLVLRLGDVITFYGPDVAIDRVAKQIGHVEREVDETDLFTFALGIAAGIGLGTLAITVGGVTIGLGMAGGLLIMGLCIGYIRSLWPFFGRVPSASRWVLGELGLMIFMSGVGLNAGGGIVEIIESAGLKLIGAGMIVTLVPVLVGYAFSRKVLNLNPAEALGGVTGSMTSGAALSVVCEASKSNAPALGYTGAYAFANVILTLAGTLMMLI